MKKYLTVFLIMMFTVLVFTSCAKQIVDDEKVVIETKENSIVSKEVVESSSNLNLNEIIESLDNQKKILESVMKESSDFTYENEVRENETIIEETKDDIAYEGIDPKETLRFDELDSMDTSIVEDDRTFRGTTDIDTSFWVYGMTPCEWVYIEPNIQIISNYKPNTSENYSIKSRVSSGVQGCFMPVFCKCEMLSNEYDGRFYCFSDYKKYTPEEMLFVNNLGAVTYKNLSIEEILRKKYDLTKTENGLLKQGDAYINIVYVTDLNRILSEENIGG